MRSGGRPLRPRPAAMPRNRVHSSRPAHPCPSLPITKGPGRGFRADGRNAGWGRDEVVVITAHLEGRPAWACQLVPRCTGQSLGRSWAWISAPVLSWRSSRSGGGCPSCSPSLSMGTAVSVGHQLDVTAMVSLRQPQALAWSRTRTASTGGCGHDPRLPNTGLTQQHADVPIEPQGTVPLPLLPLGGLNSQGADGPFG